MFYCGYSGFFAYAGMFVFLHKRILPPAVIGKYGDSVMVYADLRGDQRRGQKNEPLMPALHKATGACICVLAFFCVSCPPGMGDDVIPDSFEPVVWKDSMIFLATDNGPCQVQLWDTETRTLVRRYMFGSMQGSYIYIDQMETDKECFWVGLVGKNETLVRVDVTSGTVSKIALDIRPRYLQYIDGALWVFDPHSPWEGFKVRRLSREGALEQSLTIDRHDIDVVPYKSILRVDGDFLVPIRTNPDAEDAGNCCYIANLSRGTLTEVPVETLYPGTLLDNLGDVMYDSVSKPPDPNQGVLYWYGDAPGYADVLFVQSTLLWRWYYRVESYAPLRLSGPLITHHRQGDRSNLYLSRTGDYLFAGGRLLRYPEDDPTYSGLEIGVYPAEGGEELSFFRLWNSNQITYAKRNGETWFAKNIWSWDYENDKWNFDGETEAYILDEINVKLYRVSANGTVVLVQ